MKTNVKKMIITALLIALSIIIPIVFGSFLKVYIPPFSATLASHVPLFIAMYVGSFEASIVGLGSTLGFLVAIGNPIVAARAATHMIVGFVGGALVKRNLKYSTVMIITAPIHGILEALVVYAFTRDIYISFVVTGVGTILHHGVDSLIASPLLITLKRVLNIDLRSIGENKSKVAV